MEFKELLTELKSWNDLHIDDLAKKAKSTTPDYFIDRYEDELRDMPRIYAKIFMKMISSEQDLIFKLQDRFGKRFKPLDENIGATGMADVVGTDKPSSIDWVNSKGSKAKKGHIGMAFNKNAPGQKPPQEKTKRKKKR